MPNNLTNRTILGYKDLLAIPPGTSNELLVDVRTFDNTIVNFSDPQKIQTFSDEISGQQATNRKFLHDYMVGQGFSPFYGEWWHFSYGDREYGAIYSDSSTEANNYGLTQNTDIIHAIQQIERKS